MDREPPALQAESPDGRRARVELRGERSTIGRGTHNDLVLTDLLASREHAEIVWRDGLPWLRDLQSQNGVRVAGVRVRELPLRAGDQIGIGATRIVYHGPGVEGSAGALRALTEVARYGWSRVTRGRAADPASLERDEVRALEDLGRVVAALRDRPVPRAMAGELESARDAMRELEAVGGGAAHTIAERMAAVRLVLLGWRAARTLPPVPEVDTAIARAHEAIAAACGAGDRDATILRHVVDVAACLRRPFGSRP